MPSGFHFARTLATMHAVVALIVFSFAALTPGAELLPVVMYLVDFPISILLIRSVDLFPDRWASFGASGVFVIFGTLWFYGVGLLFERVTRAFRKQSE